MNLIHVLVLVDLFFVYLPVAIGLSLILATFFDF